MSIGAVCGRFQIFHNEHMAYVLAAAAQCDHLIVGITSSDQSVSPEEEADKNRGTVRANPCTYYERMKMIEGALLDVGLDRDKFDIVPFPIGKPDLIHYYIPAETHVFVTILDQWGHCKKERIMEAGYAVSVLWERQEKAISSTMIRNCIAGGKPWKQFVPAFVYTYVLEHKIDERIARLSL